MTSNSLGSELVTRHSSLVTPSILSVKDLRVEVPVAGKLYPAVDGVSFDVAAGECLAIVGESGCGKTLLARALVNLPPERAQVAGSVRLAGRELLPLSEVDWRAIRGPEIGFCFQEPGSAFDPVAKVGAQIGEAVRLHRDMAHRAARKVARELLLEVGFPDPDRGLDEYAHRLSGGLRQRAFLAMALAAGPKVLIADEPTTALDATVAAQVMELLQRLRRDRGLTLLLITHDLGLVARHADRALVLYAGRVAEEAVTAELFREPRHPYTQGLLASAPRVSAAGTVASGVRFQAIAGLVPDLPDRALAACGFAPRCPKRFKPCDASMPQLFERGGSKVSCFLYAEGDGATGGREKFDGETGRRGDGAIQG